MHCLACLAFGDTFFKFAAEKNTNANCYPWSVCELSLLHHRQIKDQRLQRETFEWLHHHAPAVLPFVEIVVSMV